MKYSIIVPTFNRPDEVTELLDSLTQQTFRDFEVILADGSPGTLVREVADRFISRLPLLYLYEKGLGISESRNWGVEKASGDYVIFLDSDCIAPPAYLSTIDSFLAENQAEVFGGPDATRELFHAGSESLQLCHDLAFYHGGNKRPQKAHGKVSAAQFQHGGAA